jgi:hypothetical protein
LDTLPLDGAEFILTQVFTTIRPQPPDKIKDKDLVIQHQVFVFSPASIGIHSTTAPGGLSHESFVSP